MVKYWKEGASRAWTDTWALLGKDNIPRALFSFLVLLLAILFLWLSGAWEQMTEELRWVSYILMSGGALFIPVFLFNLLVRTPYLLYREQQEKLDELSGRTVLDIDIVVHGNVGVLIPQETTTGFSERLFYLFTDVGIVNCSDQKAVIDIKIKLKIEDTVWSFHSAIRRPIPALGQRQLIPLLNVGAQESASGALLFNLNLDTLEPLGAGDLENLQKHKFYFEIYDEITKMDKSFPEGMNIRSLSD